MAIGAITSSIVGPSASGALQTGTQSAKPTSSFSAFLSHELDKANQLGQTADSLAQSYASGGSVSTAQLMIAEQQATLSVDMVAQVSNRVQQAYRTVMNMQV